MPKHAKPYKSSKEVSAAAATFVVFAMAFGLIYGYILAYHTRTAGMTITDEEAEHILAEAAETLAMLFDCTATELKLTNQFFFPRLKLVCPNITVQAEAGMVIKAKINEIHSDIYQNAPGVLLYISCLLGFPVLGAGLGLIGSLLFLDLIAYCKQQIQEKHNSIRNWYYQAEREVILEQLASADTHRMTILAKHYHQANPMVDVYSLIPKAQKIQALLKHYEIPFEAAKLLVPLIVNKQFHIWFLKILATENQQLQTIFLEMNEAIFKLKPLETVKLVERLATDLNKNVIKTLSDKYYDKDKLSFEAYNQMHKRNIKNHKLRLARLDRLKELCPKKPTKFKTA